MVKSADVSIVCANYNNGKYLVEFVESVVHSTMKPRELIIVDDGSTDDSIKILESFKHLPYLRLVIFLKNKGFTAALNEGIKISTSRYIMRADPDDILSPAKIEMQWNFLEAHPEVDVVGSNAYYFRESSDKIIQKTNFPASNTSIAKRYKSGEHGILHATAMVKSSVFKQYQYQKLTPGEDYELFARMQYDGRVMANLKEHLYLVRVHSSSASNILRYSAIEQTFKFRDAIFKTQTPKYVIKNYFHYIKYYRLFLITEGPIRYWYLAKSVLHKPNALLMRLFK